MLLVVRHPEPEQSVILSAQDDSDLQAPLTISVAECWPHDNLGAESFLVSNIYARYARSKLTPISLVSPPLSVAAVLLIMLAFCLTPSPAASAQGLPPPRPAPGAGLLWPASGPITTYFGQVGWTSPNG